MTEPLSNPFRESERDFYHAYGAAMASWANLEREFGAIFIRLSGMTREKGWLVYYSARSFLGRIDMVRCLVPTIKSIPAGKEAITRALNIAHKYASARNSLAHDAHGFKVDASGGLLDPIKLHHAILSPDGAVIEFEQIQNFQKNLTEFWMDLKFMPGEKKLLRDPELILELLDQLPDDPLSNEGDPERAAKIRSQLQHVEA